MTAAQPLLSLRNLRFRYHRSDPWVLDGLSVEFPPGAVAAVLGPNGVGKTTLLHLLIGLLRPQSGSIRIDGRPLPAFSRREMSRWIGLVPQLERIPFSFSVLEYVSMGRAPHLGMLQAPQREDVQKVERVLERMGLQVTAARSVQELSGGESQLVRIARALVQEPRVLLLDEPTAHLDLANKDRILRVLHDLAAQRMTVIFTTHDPDASFSVADFAVLMREGRALASGLVERVLNSANISEAYGLPVEVVRVDGRFVVLRQGGQQ